MSKKIFLAAPFYQYTTLKKSVLRKKIIREINSLIELLEEKGYLVYNSHKREKWGKDWMSPEICTPLDYKAICEADIFIAIPGNPPSGGVHIELGWASAFNKEIYLLLEKDRVYSNLVKGLTCLDCKVEIIEYRNFKHLLELINSKL